MLLPAPFPPATHQCSPGATAQFRPARRLARPETRPRASSSGAVTRSPRADTRGAPVAVSALVAGVVEFVAWRVGGCFGRTGGLDQTACTSCVLGRPLEASPEAAPMASSNRSAAGLPSRAQVTRTPPKAAEG